MSLRKQASLAIVLIAFSSASPTLFAASEKNSATITGNITAASTYVWRGLPQTVDAALQGGIDYATAEGLHAGIWTSNVAAGSELDFTVGFAGKAKQFGYDVGLIIYTYPQYEAAAGPTQDYNFNELYASISVDMFNTRFSTSSEAGTYIELNANVEEVVSKWDLGLHIGTYNVEADFDGLPGEDYNDYSASLSTTVNGLGLSFTLSDTDLTDDSYRTVISVSKDFTP